MTTYSRAERLEAVTKAGFKNPLTAVSVSLAEFGENRDINAQAQSDIVVDPNTGEREPSFGPWQIHLPSHPNVTRSCAMDLSCSTKAAFDISKGGTDFGAWSAYTNGSYKRFFDELTNLDPDLLKRIRTSLGAIMVGISKSGGSFEGKGDDIVKQLQKIYPDVPETTLRAIVQENASAGASNITNAPVLGGGIKGAEAVGDAAKNVADTIKKTSESADSFRAWVENTLSASNFWKVGFVLLGAGMIYAGARLYLHEPVREVA